MSSKTRESPSEIAHQAKEPDRPAGLERFQRLTIGRELKMIDLKKEIEHLRRFRPPKGGQSGDDD